MQQSKLYALLRSLDANELVALGQFVRSPYHTERKSSRLLLEALLRFRPDFTVSEADSLEIFEHLFGGEKYSRQKLRQEYSYLIQLVRDFLVTVEVKGISEWREIYYLRQLRKRKLFHLFDLKLAQLTEKQGAREKIGETHYLRQYLLGDEANEAFGQQEIRVQSPYLGEKLSGLDQFYMAVRLRESCEMLNRARLFDSDFDTGWSDEMIRMLPEYFAEMLDSPLIGGYYRIYQLLREPEEGNRFHSLIGFLDLHAPGLLAEEARAMYKYAQNYCIRRMNAGKLEFSAYLFGIYQQLVSNGLIYEQQTLAHTDFKNIVNVGLKEKAFEWVSEFIEEQQGYLIPEMRENVVKYCEALLCFTQGQYDAVLRILHQVSFTDLLYEISGRYLLIKTYYERNDWEGVSYTLIAFERFVKRNKQLSVQQREPHINFVKLMKALTKLGEKAEYTEVRGEVGRFRKRMEGIRPLVQRDWLGEKASELGG